MTTSFFLSRQTIRPFNLLGIASKSDTPAFGMEDESSSKELKNWLAEHMAEARLSAGEIKEFVQWLTHRENEGANERQIMRKSKDVEEFLGWFKTRIRESSINEAEKRQLKSWLFGKLTTSALSSDEAARIRDHLSDSADS